MYLKRCEHVSCSYSYCRYSDFAFCSEAIFAISTNFHPHNDNTHLTCKIWLFVDFLLQTHDKMHMSYRKGYMIPCIETHCIRILSHTYCSYTHISSFKPIYSNHTWIGKNHGSGYMKCRSLLMK